MSTTLAIEPAQLKGQVDLPRIVGARLSVGPSLDRRLGERRQLIEPLPGSWITTRSSEVDSWSAVEPIELRDVSATGLGFVAETVGMFRIGVHTAVAFDDHDVMVSLCRVTQLDEPGRSLYAARFVNPSPEFLAFLATVEVCVDDAPPGS